MTRQERGIWQRRFWEHQVRDEAGYAAPVRHFWFNPVKHGYVERPEGSDHFRLWFTDRAPDFRGFDPAWK